MEACEVIDKCPDKTPLFTTEDSVKDEHEDGIRMDLVGKLYKIKYWNKINLNRDRKNIYNTQTYDWQQKRKKSEYLKRGNTQMPRWHIHNYGGTLCEYEPGWHKYRKLNDINDIGVDGEKGETKDIDNNNVKQRDVTENEPETNQYNMKI